MRIPHDTVLIAVHGDDPPGMADLLAAWRDGGLPVIHVRETTAGVPVPTVLSGEAVLAAAGIVMGPELAALLEADGRTTAVLAGAVTAAAAQDAVGLGLRVFVVGPREWAVDDARIVDEPTAVAAARLATAVRVWKQQRRAAPLVAK